MSFSRFASAQTPEMEVCQFVALTGLRISLHFVVKWVIQGSTICMHDSSNVKPASSMLKHRKYAGCRQPEVVSLLTLLRQYTTVPWLGQRFLVRTVQHRCRECGHQLLAKRLAVNMLTASLYVCVPSRFTLLTDMPHRGTADLKVKGLELCLGGEFAEAR